MTQYSYNRKYELSITTAEELETVFQGVRATTLDGGSTVYRLSTGGYRTVQDTTIIINDLHIEVETNKDNKTSGSKGGTATVKIYNLSPDRRGRVIKQNTSVILKAGYEDDAELPLIFAGQVQDAFSKKDGEDIVTTLMCVDGYTPINNIRVSAAVTRGGTYAEVINTLAGYFNDNGVATGKLILDQSPILGPVLDSPPSQTFLNKQWVYSGKLIQAMNDVCKQFNYTWQIVNNALYVHPRYYKDMIGVVEVGENNILSIEDKQEGGRLPSSSSEDTGLLITLLLNGRISSEQKIRITDGDKAGDYRITSVQHKLGYETQEWYTIVECAGGEDV